MGAEIWIVFLASGLLTYLTRLSFIAAISRGEIPPLLQRALRFVPPAVLSAIVFQQIFIQETGIVLSPGNLRLWAGLLAVVIAWRTRKPLLVIACGMVALWLLAWIFRA